MNSLNLPEAVAADPPVNSRADYVLPPVGPTVAAERSFQRVLMELLRDAATATRVLLTTYPALVTSLEVTQDAPVDEMQKKFRAFRRYLDKRAKLSPRIERIYAEEEARHRKVFGDAIKQQTGINASTVMRSKDMRNYMKAQVEQSVSLIKGLTDELQKRVTTAIMREAYKGTSRANLAKVLRAEFGWSSERARFIARDQIATFNGVLNRVRQQQMGLKSYIWHTQLDEKVRPLHASREGKRYAWSMPPSDGHPGEPINCRCVARAFIPKGKQS